MTRGRCNRTTGAWAVPLQRVFAPAKARRFQRDGLVEDPVIGPAHERPSQAQAILRSLCQRALGFARSHFRPWRF